MLDSRTRDWLDRHPEEEEYLRREQAIEDDPDGSYDDEGDELMPETQHSQIEQADNVLRAADTMGVAVFARQAPEFAEDHSEDTVIVVLRGREAVAAGREALVAVADLIRNAR